MNNADLAEIRALLRETAPPERSPRPALLRRLGALLPTPPVAGGPRAEPLSARRVGLAAQPPAEAPGLDEDAETAEAGAARRRAFGQRNQPAAATRARTLLLTAPPPPGEAVQTPGPTPRRLSAPAMETPYLPEDLSDAADAADAEQVYAASGLFTPPQDVAPPQAVVAPACAPAMDTERALLTRLEQLFLLERAALDQLEPDPA